MLKLPKPETNTAKKGILLSIFTYIVLASLKCWIGLSAHSQAVFADGLNNLSDILFSLGLLIGVVVSGKPADHNHPFGHNKAENIAALAVSLLMILVAFSVWIDAIKTITLRTEKMVHSLAVYLSLGSALFMFVVSKINFHLSKKTNSQALRVNALDNRADAFISIGAAAGGVGSIGGFLWLDPVVAFFVGIVIFHTAYKIGRPAINSLMDGFDQEMIPHIKRRVLEVEGVLELREIRGRYHGPYIFVEVTIGVDGKLTVTESHDLTDRIEDKLKQFENIEHVHVHVEPISG